MKNEYFECTCRLDEHRLVFTYNKDDNELYTSIFLDNYWFLKRVWLGIKYIFGYKCKYGHFACWELNPQDIPRFKKLASLLKDFTKHKNKKFGIYIIDGDDVRLAAQTDSIEDADKILKEKQKIFENNKKIAVVMVNSQGYIWNNLNIKEEKGNK